MDRNIYSRKFETGHDAKEFTALERMCSAVRENWDLGMALDRVRSGSSGYTSCDYTLEMRLAEEAFDRITRHIKYETGIDEKQRIDHKFRRKPPKDYDLLLALSLCQRPAKTTDLYEEFRSLAMARRLFHGFYYFRGLMELAARDGLISELKQRRRRANLSGSVDGESKIVQYWDMNPEGWIVLGMGQGRRRRRIIKMEPRILWKD